MFLKIKKKYETMSGNKFDFAKSHAIPQILFIHLWVLGMGAQDLQTTEIANYTIYRYFISILLEWMSQCLLFNVNWTFSHEMSLW